jgi:hypothetical protein
MKRKANRTGNNTKDYKEQEKREGNGILKRNPDGGGRKSRQEKGREGGGG